MPKKSKFDMPAFAQRVLNRIHETEIKGEKSKSKEALACICGAAMAVELVEGAGSETAKWLTNIAWIISIRGVRELEVIAKKGGPDVTERAKLKEASNVA